jgi:phosphoglycolate phosphatase
MINGYKTIIWDWNGTLLDDSWLAVEVMDEMLKSREMQGLSIERYQELFDFPVKDYYEKLGFNFSVEPFELVGLEFIDNYNARHFECQLRQGALDVLKHIKGHGIRQFVLSARNHEHLSGEFDFYELHPYFEHFSGLSDSFANGKLELGQQLMSSQQIDPSGTLLIGDTLHDFEVAHALGINCILIEGGHQSLARLKSTNATVINRLSAIIA